MLRVTLPPLPEDDAVPYRNLTRHYAAPINGHIAGVYVKCGNCGRTGKANSTLVRGQNSKLDHCAECRDRHEGHDAT